MEFYRTSKKNYDEWTRITPQGLLYDRALFWLFVILLLIGLVAVTSASIPYSSRLFNDPFTLQNATLFMCYFLCSLVIFHYKFLLRNGKKWHAKIFLFSVILLLLVPLSVHRLMAQNVDFVGNLKLSTCRICKIGFDLFFLASYFTRRYDEVRSRHVSIFKPFIVMLVLGCFLLLQPDLGSTVVLFIIMSGMLFYRRGENFTVCRIDSIRWNLIRLASIDRLLSVKAIYRFLEPFKDPYGTGFQLTNSLIAFGRGEITGEGLGNSIQKIRLSA